MWHCPSPLLKKKKKKIKYHDSQVKEKWDGSVVYRITHNSIASANRYSACLMGGIGSLILIFYQLQNLYIHLRANNAP
jgi:hypothetical protein